MIFKCKACGGNLTYDVLTGRMRCAGCENTFTAGEIDKDNDTYFNATVCRCENCGAELITTDATEVTAFCSYCGTASVLTKRMERIKKPDYVLPFTVTKEQCKKAYLKEARRAPLAPDWMRDESSIDSFRGIYVPYWIYSIKPHGTLTAQQEIEKKRVGDYIVTYNQEYEGKLSSVGSVSSCQAVPASTQLSRDIADHIGFIQLPEAMGEFHPGYLAGFYADKAERVERRVNTLIEDEVVSSVKNQLKNRYGFKNMVGMKADIEQKKLVYCPVWLLCQKHNGQTAYAAVNGQTGQVLADFPIHTPKFLITAAVMAIIAFLLLNFSLSLRPEQAFWVTFALMLIGLIVCGVEEKKSMKISYYTGVPLTGISNEIRQLLCGVLAFVCILIIITTRNNLVIYLTSLSMAAAFIFTCVHTFRIHKQISSRRQPHFDRKGANDRA